MSDTSPQHSHPEQNEQTDEYAAQDGPTAEQTIVDTSPPVPPDQLKVNKKGFIEINGEIEELLPGLKFRVLLDNGHSIIATLAGRMRINKIMLVMGDKVRLEMSPYDLTKGRVVYRY